MLGQIASMRTQGTACWKFMRKCFSLLLITGKGEQVGFQQRALHASQGIGRAAEVSSTEGAPATYFYGSAGLDYKGSKDNATATVTATA